MTFPTMAAMKPATPSVPDQRLFRRTPLVLFGRCRILGLPEFPCHTRDISASGVAIAAPVRANLDAWAELHLDGLDVLHGEVARLFPGGFAIEFALFEKERESLSARLEQMAARLRPSALAGA